MADHSTFIKIDRNIVNWRWFKDSKVFHVFLWLLIKANIKTGYFQKDEIKRGSLATSNAHIAESCGLTIQNVRTALANLEETGEIQRIQRNHYQIICIPNYELYQSDSRKSIWQLTGNSQATNKQLTTIKEYKNKRKKEVPPKSPTGGLTSSGGLERGTDAFRAKSHLLLQPDEGTVDDIPEKYREMCGNDFAVYWRYRNQ